MPDLESHLAELELLSKELKSMEDSLSSFLREYFHRVGSIFEKIEEISDEDENQDIKLTNSGNKTQHSDFDIERETKSLYRKLIKVMHPDVNPGIPNDTVSRLNDAYTKRNLGDLRRIEIESSLKNEQNSDTAAAYQLKMLSLNNSIGKIRNKISELRDSPQFKLMMKAKESENKGIDLIEEIRKEAMQKYDNILAKKEFIEKETENV